MPDRLQVHIDVDPALLALRFPPMVLLTLVENAVPRYRPSEQGGRIEAAAGQTHDAPRAPVGGRYRLGLRGPPTRGTASRTPANACVVCSAPTHNCNCSRSSRTARAELSFTAASS
jgi:hypothetical protein